MLYKKLALIPWQRLHVQEPYGNLEEQACHDSLSAFGIGFVLCMYDTPEEQWQAVLKTAAIQPRDYVLVVVKPCEFTADPFNSFVQDAVTVYRIEHELMAMMLPVPLARATLGNGQLMARLMEKAVAGEAGLVKALHIDRAE